MAPQRPPRKGNSPPRGPKSKSSSHTKAGGPPQRKGPGSRRPVAQTPPRRPALSSKASAPTDQAGESSGPERLQKILAHAGIGSRRACEDLILQGRVTVGGQVIRELGTKVDPARSPVAVDGQKVQVERPVYFAVYKPKGYVSTNNDPSGRPRVLDLLPEIPQRVYTVGRLDEMSVGLMLLTNDGELANKLAHPRFGVEKLYRVVVAGSPTREVLTQLTEGIWLAEGKVRAKRVRAIGKRGDSTILELVLAEGKNREVRRMLAKLGHKVMMLTRVAVGPITVKGLVAGQFRPLTGREVDLLRRVAAGQPVPMPWMTDRSKTRPLPDRPRRPEGGGRTGPPSSGDSRPGPRGRSGSAGGPPRYSDGPRNGPGPVPRNSNGPGFPQHPGTRPSERPGAGRRPGPRPDGPPPGSGAGHRYQDGGPPRQDGPRQFRDNGPRPSNRPGEDRRLGGYGQDRRAQSEDRRPGGSGQDRRAQGEGGPPRQFRDNGPRPSHRPGEDRRPGPRPNGPPGGSAPGGRRDQGDGPPRQQEGGPRQFREDGPRPSNRPGQDRRPGPRPGDSGPAGGRRPGPPPSQEPPRRRVIGMELEATPGPGPASGSGSGPGRDDRPKPRMKRPTGKRPAPRPTGGSRPMPKPRKGGRSRPD
jgi:23S rRNA pseudouridine2605 synthase